MDLRKYIAVAALFSCGAADAQATTWEYNGSAFTLEASGVSRKFIYESPRDGLPVSKGTIVFQGRRAGQTYSGTAYVFSKLCGEIGYPVSGAVSADDRTVTSGGKVPVRNAQCKVARYEDNFLVFNLVEPSNNSTVTHAYDCKNAQMFLVNPGSASPMNIEGLAREYERNCPGWQRPLQSVPGSSSAKATVAPAAPTLQENNFAAPATTDNSCGLGYRGGPPLLEHGTSVIR